jgi:acyl carrier protein
LHLAGILQDAIKAIIMDINEFVEKFAEQFDDTDESEFTPSTVFSQLDEWSSLTSLAIIAFVRTDYGKKITALDIRSCETIEDLFNLVKSR